MNRHSCSPPHQCFIRLGTPAPCSFQWIHISFISSIFHLSSNMDQVGVKWVLGQSPSQSQIRSRLAWPARLPHHVPSDHVLGQDICMHSIHAWIGISTERNAAPCKYKSSLHAHTGTYWRNWTEVMVHFLPVHMNVIFNQNIPRNITNITRMGKIISKANLFNNDDKCFVFCIKKKTRRKY